MSDVTMSDTHNININKNTNTNNGVVVLDIGGIKYKTTISTLCGLHVNFFSAMFGGNFSPKPQNDGSFFIDRNGENFKYILEYLREGNVVLPTSHTELIALYREAKYYQITELQQQIYPKLESKAIVDLLHQAVDNRLAPSISLKWIGSGFKKIQLIDDGRKMLLQFITNYEYCVIDATDDTFNFDHSQRYSYSTNLRGLIEPQNGELFLDTFVTPQLGVPAGEYYNCKIYKDGTCAYHKYDY